MHSSLGLQRKQKQTEVKVIIKINSHHATDTAMLEVITVPALVGKVLQVRKKHSQDLKGGHLVTRVEQALYLLISNL